MALEVVHGPSGNIEAARELADLLDRELDALPPNATLALTGNLFEHFHITASCRSAAA